MNTASNTRFKYSPETHDSNDLNLFILESHDFLTEICNKIKPNDIRNVILNIRSKLYNLKIYSDTKDMTLRLFAELKSDLFLVIKKLGNLMLKINEYADKNILKSKLGITIQNRHKMQNLLYNMELFEENICDNKYKIYNIIS